ncbi:hypothetical protein Tco_1326658 [Tanacetum coccineum]
MADLIQDNLALEERLDKHGTRLYNLENLNISHKVSQAVDEIVTDAVDWEMQASLRARFRDLPTKSLELDYSNQRLADQEEARPSGSSQMPPPPPPPSTGTSGYAQQKGGKAPSSSKTTVSTHQSMAWTTSDTRYESTGFTATHETSPSNDLIHDDSILDEQNNWTFALVSTYKLPAENSLLAKTGDMMTYINWYYRQVNKTVLTQGDFKGKSYEVVKAFYPDVWVEDFQLGIKSYQSKLNLTKPGWDATSYEFKHDYTIIGTRLHSQGIQGQAAQSGDEYAILDSKGRDKEQRVHSGY